MITIEQLTKDSRELGECNDCVVKCLSVVTSVPYKKVHTVCLEHGRKHRRGMYVHQWSKALLSLGYVMVNETEHYRALGGKTAKSIVNILPRKPYIVRFRGHVAGWNGQTLVDWTDGRRHRVIGVYSLAVHLSEDES